LKVKLTELNADACSMNGSRRPLTLQPFDQNPAPLGATTTEGGSAPIDPS